MVAFDGQVVPVAPGEEVVDGGGAVALVLAVDGVMDPPHFPDFHGGVVCTVRDASAAAFAAVEVFSDTVAVEPVDGPDGPSMMGWGGGSRMGSFSSSTCSFSSSLTMEMRMRLFMTTLSLFELKCKHQVK